MDERFWLTERDVTDNETDYVMDGFGVVDEAAGGIIAYVNTLALGDRMIAMLRKEADR